jgi:ATP-binding cassette subfamily B protein
VSIPASWPKSRTWKVLCLLAYYLPERLSKRLWLLLPSAAGVALLDLLLIMTVANLVGLLARGGGFPIQQPVLHVMALGWLLAFCRWGLRRSQYRLGAAVWRNLGEQLMARILNQPYEFHINRSRSELTIILLQQLPPLGSLLVSQALLLISNATSILLLSGGLLVLAGPSGLLLLLFLVLAYVLMVQQLKPQLLHWRSELVATERKAHALTVDILTTIRTIKMVQVQPAVLRAHEQIGERLEKAEAAAQLLPELPRLLVEPMGLCGVLLLLLLPTIRAQGIASLPWLALLTLALVRLAQPLQECSRAITLLQSNLPQLEELLELLRLPLCESAEAGRTRATNRGNTKKPPITGPIERSHQPNATNPESKQIRSSTELQYQHIALAGMDFSYQDRGAKILKGLDLKLKQGERLALVGRSGSGKSTVAALLLGLLTPEHGRLEIDGNPMSTKQIKAWQQRCAEVAQPLRLLHGTIAENVAFWREEISEEQIWWALGVAQLAETVRRWPLGLQHNVGEDGAFLSGGQRQRLAIARALVQHPRLLVLDEATSALDRKTESSVLATLETLGPDTTILLITHKLKLMRHCSRIVLLENGKISASGSLSQLQQSSLSFQQLIDHDQRVDGARSDEAEHD